MKFAADDPALWPTQCPNCAYSWQGLTVPRCPECGEQVGEGEIVIVGVSRIHQGRFTGENWGSEFWSVGLGLMVACVVMVVIKHATLLLALGMTCVAACWCGAIFVPVTLYRKRAGCPVGVVRLSAEGFRVGAGERVGWQRPWGKHTRIELTQMGEGIRLCIWRMNGRVALWKAVDLEFRGSSSIGSVLHEQLQAWTGRQILYRDRSK